jgi:predicted negative regulator of RcsB-dependent stress response
MSYNLEEQDQIALLRDLWERWGGLVSALALAAALAWAGYSVWNWRTAQQAGQASALYADIGHQLGNGNLDAARPAWEHLRDDFARTPYAGMGALALAKGYADRGQATAAQGVLEWAAQHAEPASFRAAALLNLSALQADAHQLPAALASVQTVPAPAFEGVFAVRRGDLHALIGQPAQARADYQRALQALPADSAYRSYVQIKLDSVGGDAS